MLAAVTDRPAPFRALLTAYAVLAVLDLVAVAAHLPALAWASKPLLAPVLALAVARALPGHGRTLVAGLLCATAGDIALLLPGTAAFLAGMTAFLAMHLCYISAFRRRTGTRLTARAAVPYAVVWAGANVVLAPRLGALAVPVVVYSAVLLAMAATAGLLGRRGLLGGALFAVSDLMIGAGAAGIEFPGRSLLVMATYVAAQALLVTAYVHPGD